MDETRITPERKAELEAMGFYVHRIDTNGQNMDTNAKFTHFARFHHFLAYNAKLGFSYPALDEQSRGQYLLDAEEGWDRIELYCIVCFSPSNR